MFGATFLGDKLGIGTLPEGVTYRHVLGLAVTAGIGFTVALFVAGLAFEGDPAFTDSAKIGILARLSRVGDHRLSAAQDLAGRSGDRWPRGRPTVAGPRRLRNNPPAPCQDRDLRHRHLSRHCYLCNVIATST